MNKLKIGKCYKYNYHMGGSIIFKLIDGINDINLLIKVIYDGDAVGRKWNKGEDHYFSINHIYLKEINTEDIMIELL